MSKPIKAMVFDAYGTLFDVHSVAALGEQLFPGHGGALSQLWRSKQLEYTWLRSLMGRYEDFTAVTEAALGYACRQLELPLDAAKSRQLMAAYDHLALYPDARDALAGLTGLKLAILSNGSPAMLGPLVKNAGSPGDRQLKKCAGVSTPGLFGLPRTKTCAGLGSGTSSTTMARGAPPS